MATLMEIEEAIKSIDTKKQSLKKSFDVLHNNSHSLSSFTLTWPQIDSHFSHIQSSLLSRFSLLQQHHQNPNNDQKIQSLPRFEVEDEIPDVQNPKNDQSKQSLPELDGTQDDENPEKEQKELSLSQDEQNEETPDDQKPENDEKIQSSPELERSPDDENPKIDQKEPSLHNSKQNEEDPDVKNQQKVHLKSICERMEGEKLGKMVKDSSELEELSVNELSQALKYAPDPYKLVLDATEGSKPRDLVSVILFESLMMIEEVEFSEEMRDRAKCVAFKWKDEVNKGQKSPLDALGLLSLLACFKLVNDFDKDDVAELVNIGSKDARAVKLCTALGLQDIVLGTKEESLLTQVSRHHPPEFYGGVDPVVLEDWIREMEILFIVVDVPIARQVEIATYYLKGQAEQWWSTNESRVAEPEFNWESLKILLREKFYPTSLKIRKQEEFLRLVQGTMTVQEYADMFLELGQFAPDFTANDAMKQLLFQKGLNIRLRQMLAVQTFSTCQELIDRATRVEHLLRLERSDGGNTTNKRKYDQRSSQSYSGAQSKKQYTDEVPLGSCRSRTMRCTRCGRNNHTLAECRHKANVCFMCKKPDHVKRNCPLMGDRNQPAHSRMTSSNSHHPTRTYQNSRAPGRSSAPTAEQSSTTEPEI